MSLLEIQADDVARSLIRHPITDKGRMEIQEVNGMPHIAHVYGINKSFAANYEYPILHTPHDSVLGLWNAFVTGDVSKEKMHTEELKTAVYSYDMPVQSRDNISKVVTSMEYSFIESKLLVNHSYDEKRQLALLNPSPGTISRMAKTGHCFDVYMTSPKDEDLNILSDRIASEGYKGQVNVCDGYRNLPDLLYYCGMSADKAYHNKVKNFFGFALNPYAYLASGHEFWNSTPTDYGQCYEYVRNDYIATSYYYTSPSCYRYATDVLESYLETSKELKFNHPGFSHLFQLYSSSPLRKLCAPEVVDCASVPVDVQYYSVNEPVKICQDKDGIKWMLVGEFVLDVISPYDRSTRDWIITRHSKRPRMVPSKQGNYVRYPTMSRVSKQSIFRVSAVEVETEATAYLVQTMPIHSPNVIYHNGGIILKKNIPLQHRVVYRPIGDHVFMAYNGDSSCWIRCPNPDGYRNANAYDFLRQKPCYLKYNTENHLTFLSNLGEISTMARVKLKGCYPDYGDTKKMHYYGNGNAYERNKQGKIFLREHTKGDVFGPDGKRFIIDGATHGISVSLAKYSTQSATLCGITYMGILGRVSTTKHVVDESYFDGISVPAEILDDNEYSPLVFAGIDVSRDKIVKYLTEAPYESTVSYMIDLVSYSTRATPSAVHCANVMSLFPKEVTIEERAEIIYDYFSRARNIIQ